MARRRKPTPTLRRRPQQMRMNVRLYRVSIDDFGECEVQASGRAGARWRAFQIGREAGYFGAGFRDFIARRPRVAELRQECHA